jgi:hypothetical protein
MYLLGRSRTGGQSPGLSGEDLGLQARTVQPAGACRTGAVSGTAPPFMTKRRLILQPPLRVRRSLCGRRWGRLEVSAGECVDQATHERIGGRAILGAVVGIELGDDQAGQARVPGEDRQAGHRLVEGQARVVQGNIGDR